MRDATRRSSRPRKGLRSLHEGQLPSYPFPESAGIALARVVRYGRWRAAPEGAERRFEDVDTRRAQAALGRARARAGAGESAWLDPDETRELLSAYGLATPPSRVVRDEEEAVRAAAAAGGPVVLKLVSPSITHKSDVGGVVLDVRSASEVREAFRGIGARLEERGWGDRMEGVLVQPMIREGVEAIVGVTHDRSFGPLVMFGIGGVLVELLRDVAFRVRF